MTDWFEWNGRKCTELGIHVEEQPPITLPAERATFTNIPGRSGSLTVLEGDDVYDDLQLSCKCFIASTEHLNEIAAWLRGGGTVTFANRPGGFYYARITNQIPFEKILRGNPHLSFSVNFRCKPYFYLDDGEDITVTSTGTFLTNPGAFASEPVITVNGSGDISLLVGMSIVELTDVSGSITLDTPLQEAYKNNTGMNDHMDGDFPILPSGRFAVSWNGNVTSVVITPNWRTL